MISLKALRRSMGTTALVVVGLGVVSVGCEKKGDDDKADSAAPAVAPPPPATPPPATPPPATPAPAPAPAGDVTRYPDEQPLAGGATISNDVAARKQASLQSEVVQNLAHGSAVAKVARSGNWTLVSWKQAAGDKMGWVETTKAFRDNDDDYKRTVPDRVLDEGRRRGVLPRR